MALMAGTENTGHMALDCFEYLQGITDKSAVLVFSNTLFGIFIRVLNYKLNPDFKLRMINI